MKDFQEQIQAHLEFVYGAQIAGSLLPKIMARLDAFERAHPGLAKPLPPAQRVTEADSMLITYGDQLVTPNEPPLRTLGRFCAEQLAGVVSSVHLLPFYPYSSDDGFSVIDYTAVNPALGDWADLQPLRRNFRLMFDAVINHISVQSDWFKGFLAGEPRYANYFITQSPNTDLSSITRPRTLPLLTAFETATGQKHIWTTFSADQVDLNYKEPAVLLEIIDVLLFYVAQGAEFIRLDAIGFMWKEVGTTSLHLPQTHRLIQLFRTVLNAVAPNVLLITETNVPHRENISYFGNGFNEAQLVYNFSLAPLILHAFHTGSASVLQQWAAGLESLSEATTFFNFIASHDGIGVRPAEGILSPAEVQALAEKTLAHGGRVSYKTNPNGSQSAYELNITLFDALSDPAAAEPQALQVDRFIASQAIMLALIGVPGIYVHSLFGSHNDTVGMEETGRARSINRQKWLKAEVEAVLANRASHSSQVFDRYRQLLRARRQQAAFHPNGEQQVLRGNPALFSLLRVSPDGTRRVLCLHNITAQPQSIAGSDLPLRGQARNLLSGETVNLGGDDSAIELPPYGVLWLK